MLYKTININEYNDLNSIIVEHKSVYNTINIFLVILENLGFLDPSEIEKKLDDKLNFYDKSILYRLRISNRNDELKYIKDRFPTSEWGIGELKILQLKEKYTNLTKNWLSKDRNAIEIIEELIFEVKLEVSRYENILREFNVIVKSLIENKKLSEVDRIVMIDYWTSYYKEKKLGYPLDINQRIITMTKDLKRLEFGGYGELAIKDFLDKCQTKIEVLKQGDMNNEEIVTYISEHFYNQLIERYESELLILKRRISIIDSSKVISPRQKALEIEQFIIDFNERNGHKIDLSNQILEMKQGLSRLKSSEDDASIIDWFINKAQDMIIKEKKTNKSDKLILATIRIDYYKYYHYYSNRLERLEEHLQRANSKEHDSKEFAEESPTYMDLSNKIAKLLTNMEESENFTLEEITKFKNDCHNIERENILSDKIQKSSTEIEELYEKILIENTQKRKHQSEQLQTRISLYANMLSKLGEYGYGVSAIDEFKNSCNEIVTSRSNYIEKNLIIDQKFRLLKEHYYTNEKTFTIWKERELKKNRVSEREADIKIRKLISLSPRELQLYYEEDDKRKKQAMEDYNNRLLTKFLAEEEAAKTSNQAIISERLQSLESGTIPYTFAELARAREALEEREYLAELNHQHLSERLVSLQEYIDSTLYKQISSIVLKE